MNRLVLVLILTTLSSLSCGPSASQLKAAWPSTPKVDFTTEELATIEAEFHKTFDQEIAALGGPLEIKFFKTIPNTLSFATIKGDTHHIAIMGGNLTKKYMTMDSLRLLVCHETGHFLGGGPKRKLLDPEEDQDWNVVEGGADYFASVHCMKRILNGQDHKAALANIQVPTLISERCHAAFDIDEEAMICERSMLAGQTLINFFASIKGTEDQPSRFETPSEVIIDKTMAEHPPLQCRLDTYAAGALCALAPVPLDESDLSVGTCESYLFDKDTHRPRCWFNPKDFEPNSGLEGDAL